jgi:hypothetical protein
MNDDLYIFKEGERHGGDAEGYVAGSDRRARVRPTWPKFRPSLPRGLLQQINLGNIRKAVGWRNKVVHVTGQLPDGISNSELRETISAVLDLTQWLGTHTQQQEA